MLQRIFQRYTGWLRGLKAAYVLNNLLQAPRLRHNRALYRQYGLSKSIFSPLGSADFAANPSPDIPWIDRPGAEATVENHPDFKTFSPEIQAQIRLFLREGYLILENFFPQEKTDALANEVAQAIASGKAGFNFTGRKIFNYYEHSPLADQQFFRHQELLRLLSFLLGKPVLPFQTLNFTHGSEQRAHSDSIHMSTEPQGYLIATWIALEDCTPENGALFYYPGSHRLPYVTSRDYDSGNTFFTIGADNNKHYEDKIEALIQEHNLKPWHFYAKRGDVLVWHANLLHGGSPIRREGASRLSMVCHYYAEGVICYHEMTQRPALLPRQLN